MSMTLRPVPLEYPTKIEIDLEHCWDAGATSARRIINFMVEANLRSTLRRFRSPAADLWLQLELFIRASGYEIQIEDYIPDPGDPDSFTFVVIISQN
jgi:hypothetical protein